MQLQSMLPYSIRFKTIKLEFRLPCQNHNLVLRENSQQYDPVVKNFTTGFLSNEFSHNVFRVEAHSNL